MTGLDDPHGSGPLRPLLLAGQALAEERRRAATLPGLRVSSRERGDILMLGIGGFTPLDGFMTSADWRGVYVPPPPCVISAAKACPTETSTGLSGGEVALYPHGQSTSSP